MNFNELSEEQLAKLVPGTPEYKACDRFFKMRILGLLNQRIKFMKDQETKEKFIELRASGKSYAAIAGVLGICKLTAIRWGRELKERIDAIHAIEADALCEKYALGVKARMELFANQFQRVKQEIEARGLDDVSTSKLLSMLHKASSAFKREQDALQFHETPSAPSAAPSAVAMLPK